MSKRTTRCGECGQKLPVTYRRPITSRMARALLVLYGQHTRGVAWTHVDNLVLAGLSSGGDLAKTVYWGLAESAPNANPKKKRASGLWRITTLGIEFVLGNVTVPYAAVIKQRRLQRLDDSKRRSVHEALGKKFILAELLAGASVEPPNKGAP